MESLDPAALFIDSLLDFSSDIGEEDDEDGEKLKDPFALNDSKQPQQNNNNNSAGSDSLPNQDCFPVFAEEELEWLSNQDAFPPIEGFDLLPSKLENLPTSPLPVKPENVTTQKSVFVKLENVIKSQDPVPVKHENVMKRQNPENVTKSQSPVSVLGNSSGGGGVGGVRIPVQARSKRRRQRRNFSDLSSQHWWYRYEEPKKRSVGVAANPSGRKCLHCQSEKTPQWRAGPLGPKTLCNACGVRYKSGRLLPEYRPASSPTFSEELHSNSHRKVLDMRKQKERQMFMPSSNNGWLVG